MYCITATLSVLLPPVLLYCYHFCLTAAPTTAFAAAGVLPPVLPYCYLPSPSILHDHHYCRPYFFMTTITVALTSLWPPLLSPLLLHDHHYCRPCFFMTTITVALNSSWPPLPSPLLLHDHHYRRPYFFMTTITVALTSSWLPLLSPLLFHDPPYCRHDSSVQPSNILPYCRSYYVTPNGDLDSLILPYCHLLLSSYSWKLTLTLSSIPFSSYSYIYYKFAATE